MTDRDPDPGATADGIGRRRFLALAATGTAGLAGCSAALDGDDSTRTYQPPASVRTRPPNLTTTAAGTPPESRYQAVYEAALPSVAVVRTGDGQGTCWAYDEDHLVTNQHVVEDAATVSIRYARDDWSRADVVATDVYSDLAVLSAPDRPSYVTARSLVDYPPVVGQEVVVVGTPFGLRGTLTTGVVSGVDRALEATTGFSVPGAVQTDAAVNPGNSGGPLLSLDGEVLAVISAGGGENIGFGIPPQLVSRVVPDLIAVGDYQHPFLGVSLTEVTPQVAAANGLARPRGVIVTDVLAQGPSDGVLRPAGDDFFNGDLVPTGGDIIVRVADRPVSTLADLLTYLSFQVFPGDDLPLTVLREGTERTVTVEVGVRPAP